jgi:hypothetical protein
MMNFTKLGGFDGRLVVSLANRWCVGSTNGVLSLKRVRSSPVPAAFSAVRRQSAECALTLSMIASKPVKVTAGLFVTNLIEVDDVKTRFQIGGYLFLSRKDPRLAFAAADTRAHTDGIRFGIIRVCS